MDEYNFLSSEQVTAAHTLFKFLRKLRIVGVIHTQVTAVAMTEYGRPRRYRIIVSGYEPGVYVTNEDKLDNVLRQLSAGFDGPYTPEMD